MLLNLSEEQRAEHNRIARRAFARGIQNGRLREKMLIRGASSLEDAISYAAEADNEARISIPRSELLCRNCRNNGHREKDCREKEIENSSDIAKLARALRNLNRPNNFNMRRNFFNGQRR